MAGLSTLGGLTIRELLIRTVRESWQDEVFGLAARLAFYHFLAIFPVLLLLLIPLAQMAGTGADMRNVLAGSLGQFLPREAAQTVTEAMKDLDTSAHAGGILLWMAGLGAVWAGINASWAMIVGLNTAYETKEDRSWFDIAISATGLSFAVVALVFTALFATHMLGLGIPVVRDGGVLSLVAEWAGIVCILMVSFALFYRFGPNLKDAEWRWSTPGALVGGFLWITATLLIRFYFDRLSQYHHIYGRLAPVAMLMIWLYATSATVLIGAEVNSEIEKASEERHAARSKTR
jgi:membrane protein